MHEHSDSDLKAFQQEVEDFLQQRLPATAADAVKRGASVGKEALAEWTKTLNAKGWAAPHWPEAYGGTNWTLTQRHLFDVLCRRYHAPYLSGFGFNMVGPAIIKYGTEAQKAEFLPKIRNADLWFCQGYSEPQAGSDLASLRTRADRDGDEYLVNGAKIWTSAAEIADWIFCLVRTDSDAKPQRGISFLLIDMQSPGIKVQPLYAFNGKRLWNQVFFTDVRVPVEQRLGEENKGWTVAKSLLGDERLMVSRVAENRRILGLLREAWAHQASRGVELPAHLHAEMDQLQIRLDALEATSLRLLMLADAGGVVGVEPSMLKLKGSELVQDQDELLFRLADYLVMPQDGHGAHEADARWAEYIASGRYHHRGYTIAGGSTEIQRNIIAAQGLQL